MNSLASETSPYLLQHADNPVDWQPWGELALSQARAEGKPVLLSVGYSACHWCHVMAHESFENPATAELMNRLFVNIKVDREERPDIDKIYQTAHQLITQRPGGWPLTVFLTPDEQLPFFAGTYFPDQPRYGMPGFPELLVRVAQHYEGHKDELRKQGQAVVNAFRALEHDSSTSVIALNRTPIDRARAQLGDNFDREWGGFGSAPKFPHPDSIDRLLRHWYSTAHGSEPDIDALYMSALALTRMLDGGIYDQLGGGFCRYSVDARWEIPHFEKMLYDNGPLLALLGHLWQASGDDRFRRAANDTADWVLRDMQSPAGGFWSTLDADSEGEEGRFYIWTPEQIRSLLDDQEVSAISHRFGLDGPANFEGRWHFVIRQSEEAVAEALGVSTPHAVAIIDAARAKLLANRNTRIWPGRDEKILTGWNGLMIRGLAVAATALGRDDLAEAAAQAVNFIQEKMIVNGRLMACHKDNRARFPAYLDDHAFLLDGILELLQVSWDATHLEFACWLADCLLENFADNERGGFYFTGHDHEKLIHRTRSFSDEATPSGNGIAALVLGRLGHLLGESRYLDAAEKTLRAGWAGMTDFPHGHTSLITALEEYLTPPEIIIIRGQSDAARDWSTQLRALYAPGRMVIAIPADAVNLPGALALRKPDTETIAYLCRGTSCSAPLTTLTELVRELKQR